MRYINPDNLPSPIPQAIEKAQRDERLPETLHGKPVYRVSTLIDSPRRVQLTKRHEDEIEINVSDCLYSLEGQIVHFILQSAAYDINCIPEERYFEEIDGAYVTGRVDLYEKKEARITDYKRTAVYGVANGVKREWEAQVNVYAWLLRKAGREVRGAQVVVFLRDHSKRKMEWSKDYPRVGIHALGVELWEPEEVEAYIRERIAAHREAEALRDPDLPLCTPDERWAKPDQWAVKKRGQKRAVRVFDLKEQALEYQVPAGAKYTVLEIEHRQGEDVRCEVRGWCVCREFCGHYQGLRGTR